MRHAIPSYSYIPPHPYPQLLAPHGVRARIQRAEDGGVAARTRFGGLGPADARRASTRVTGYFHMF